jgi:hypothetical protein
MAYKEPDTGEDAFLLLLVDGLIDKDLSADHPSVEIDQALHGTGMRRHNDIPPASQDFTLDRRYLLPSPL